MPRFVTVVKQAAVFPVQAIQGVVGFICMILGLYVASPFYVSSSSSALALTFQETFWQHIAIGLGLFALPALPIVLSFFFKRFDTLEWYSRSTFMMFVGLLFLTFLRILTLGFFPVTWVLTLGLALIIGICHMYWRLKVNA